MKLLCGFPRQLFWPLLLLVFFTLSALSAATLTTHPSSHPSARDSPKTTSDPPKIVAQTTPILTTADWAHISGVVNCAAVTPYAEGDFFKFKLDTTPAHAPISNYISPISFIMNFYVNSTVSVAQYSGLIVDLQSGTMTTHFGAIDCEVTPTFHFFLEIRFEMIRDDIVTHQVPVFLDLIYDPADDDLPESHTELELVFNIAPIFNHSNHTSHSTLVSTLEPNPLAFPYQYTFFATISNTTSPVDQLYIRFMGRLSALDAAATGASTPSCLVNGIAMAVTPILNKHLSEAEPDVEYLLTFPTNFTPFLASSAAEQAHIVNKMSQHGLSSSKIAALQAHLAIPAPNDPVQKTGYLFSAQSSLYIACDLHVVYNTFHSFPPNLAISLMNSQTQPNSSKPSTPDTLTELQDISPTFVYSVFHYDLFIRKIPLDRQIAFKQISLPLIHEPVSTPPSSPAPTSTTSLSRTPQFTIDPVSSPLFFRQLLIPNNPIKARDAAILGPDDDEIQDPDPTHDYTSFFQFSYNILGDNWYWKSSEEEFTFKLQHLPTSTHIVDIKYVLYGFNSTYYDPPKSKSSWLSNDVDDLDYSALESPQATPGLTPAQPKVILARDTIFDASTSRKWHPASDLDLSEVSFTGFIPSVLADRHVFWNDDRFHGELQISIVLKHADISDSERKLFPSDHIHSQPQTPSVPVLDPIQPLAILTYAQTWNRTMPPPELRGNLESFNLDTAGPNNNNNNNDHSPYASIDDELLSFNPAPFAASQPAPNTLPSRPIPDRHDHDGEHDGPAGSRYSIRTEHVYQFTQSMALVHSQSRFTISPTRHTETVNQTDATTPPKAQSGSIFASLQAHLATAVDHVLDLYSTNNLDQPRQSMTEQGIMSKVYVEQERWYRWKITIANITTPTPLEHFYLHLPTAQYSFYGNFTGCTINEHPVHPIPATIDPAKHTFGKLYFTSTLFFPGYTIYPSTSYVLSCEDTALLKPTIPLYFGEHLYNDHIRIMLSNRNPLVEFAAASRDDADPVNTNMKKPTSNDDRFYFITTEIPFTDHLRPSTAAFILGAVVIIGFTTLMLVLIYFGTKKWCLLVAAPPKELEPVGDDSSSYQSIN